MTTPRIFVEAALATGVRLALDPARASYIATVLRLRPSDDVHVFNADDGEWAATIVAAARRTVELDVGDRLRPPAYEPGPTLVFAPVRRSRTDWLVEKAVELGVRRLTPVLTARSVAKLDNPARLRAIAVEAAEQCGRLDVPALDAPVPLATWLNERDPGERTVLADESRDGSPLLAALPADAFVIGPEGGFAPAELAALRDAPGIVAVTLGPRILRAETAALTALAADALTRSRDRAATINRGKHQLSGERKL